jgi:hypothetical protein
MPDPVLIQPSVFPNPPALVPRGDEVVLVHPSTGLEYRLNRTALFMWESLQEPTTMAALRERIHRTFDVDADAAAQTAEAFVQRLSELGFLELLPQDDGLSAMRRRYLQLLKKALVNMIYPEHELRLRYLEASPPTGDRLGVQRALRDLRYADAESFAELVACKQDGQNFRRAVTRDAHTMIGLRRLTTGARHRSSRPASTVIEAASARRRIIFMRSTHSSARRMWVADCSKVCRPAHRSGCRARLLRRADAVASAPSSADNFRTYDLLSDGAIRQRLVRNARTERVETIARWASTDLYESTRDVLGLYERDAGRPSSSTTTMPSAPAGLPSTSSVPSAGSSIRCAASTGPQRTGRRARDSAAPDPHRPPLDAARRESRRLRPARFFAAMAARRENG